jgi:ubiquinol-cytochrome c reductase cytochrome c subunit
MKFAHRVSMGLAALAAGLVVGHGAAVAASAEKGKAAFVQHGCWQCHGFVGQGSVASSGGKVLTRTEMPLETFVAFVRSTNRTMPPFSEKILPNEDLADIYAYLQSIPKPASYKSIPLLNQ